MHVGDWKCSVCFFWNTKFNKYCRGRGKRDRYWPTGKERCGRKRTGEDVVQEDDGVVRFRRAGMRVGDWFCGPCAYWNGKGWEKCKRCKMARRNVVENEMMDAGDRIVARTDV